MLALWFGGLYCFLGCEMGFRANAMPAQHSSVNHEAGQATQDCADGCCKKPVSRSEHGKAHTSEMECCRTNVTLAVEKAKHPKLVVVPSIEPAAEISLSPVATRTLSPETPRIDFGETYLRLHILLI